MLVRRPLVDVRMVGSLTRTMTAAMAMLIGHVGGKGCSGGGSGSRVLSLAIAVSRSET